MSTGNPKFYRNTVTFTVLTEDEALSDDLSLETIARECDTGEFVGGDHTIVSTELTGKEAADALYDLGSEPAFFRLDADGNLLDES